MYERHVPASHTGKVQFVAGEFFDLYGTVAIHDLGSRVDLVIRTARENEDCSTPDALDVRFRFLFGCPDCSEISNHILLEIGTWSTHEPCTRHVPRLA